MAEKIFETTNEPDDLRSDSNIIRMRAFAEYMNLFKNLAAYTLGSNLSRSEFFYSPIFYFSLVQFCPMEAVDNWFSGCVSMHPSQAN